MNQPESGWRKLKGFLMKPLNEPKPKEVSHPGKAEAESMTEQRTKEEALGLLEGEEVRFEYLCVRFTDFSDLITENHNGLLTFTNENVVYLQNEGRSNDVKDWAQALRIPLEQINGVVSQGRGFLQGWSSARHPHIRIVVGVSGASEQHDFMLCDTKLDGQVVRMRIEKLLSETRQERRRMAQEALAKGTIPQMIFCRFCGTRNKFDQSICVNCGAPLNR